jgi:hypothetical protein
MSFKIPIIPALLPKPTIDPALLPDPPDIDPPAPTDPVSIWYTTVPIKIDWGKLELGPVNTGKPKKRQVSTNGRDWVDYDRLMDADDFELYAHRREI